jgi:hypothetical protein
LQPYEPHGIDADTASFGIYSTFPGDRLLSLGWQSASGTGKELDGMTGNSEATETVNGDGEQKRLLHQAVSICLYRAEGRTPLPAPVTFKGRGSALWSDANMLLRYWAVTAPKPGWGYHKVDVTIEFEDGCRYKGRFDLMSEHSFGSSLLQEHIRITASGWVGLQMFEEAHEIGDHALSEQ